MQLNCALNMQQLLLFIFSDSDLRSQKSLKLRNVVVDQSVLWILVTCTYLLTVFVHDVIDSGCSLLILFCTVVALVIAKTMSSCLSSFHDVRKAITGQYGIHMKVLIIKRHWKTKTPGWVLYSPLIYKPSMNAHNTDEIRWYTAVCATRRKCDEHVNWTLAWLLASKESQLQFLHWTSISFSHLKWKNVSECILQFYFGKGT